MIFAIVFASGTFVALSSGVSGASTNVVYECGSLSFVSVCGTPQYVANTLATDEVNYLEEAYSWTVPEQAAVFQNMVNDLNTVSGFGEGLPQSEQAQIKSDLGTARTYFDVIKDNLIINDPSFNTNAIAAGLLNGLCAFAPELCTPAF